jgi:hypothetical protein
MRKLKLDLDSLDVQSFATDAETPASGTVFAQSGLCQSTYYGCTYTDFESCATCQTCDDMATCWWTCAGNETCEWPC